MFHRHLNHQSLTLAAIDDIIARGERADWAALNHALTGDRDLAARIVKVCHAKTADPYAQRFHFWQRYAERRSG